MIAHFSFQVSQGQFGQSLLQCLLPAAPYLNEARWLELLQQGLVKVDGHLAKGQEQLSIGQNITYTVPDHEEGQVDTGWELLWHDHNIAAIHKPANLPVSRTTRNVYNTLIQLLRRESPWPDAHLLHRLDLETSGIILIGQNNEVAKTHQPNLPSLIKRKIYHAIVHGEPSWQQLDFECELNTLKTSPIRCQMHQVAKGEGKLSRTVFNVLKQNNGFSLLECELKTGRKHQIRAHLSQLGHPIVGDKIYSNNGAFYLKRLEDQLTQEDHAQLLTPHHLLHAYAIDIQPEPSSKPVQITDTAYSEAWQDFAKHKQLQLLGE